MRSVEQIEKLLEEKLDESRIRTRKQAGRDLSYLEGWDVEAEANKVFGGLGWSRETLDLEKVHEPYKNHNDNHVVSYSCRVRVTVVIGSATVVRDGIGGGSGTSRNLSDAFESALKEAETDATKRAFKTFGWRFGLALYDGTQRYVEGATGQPRANEGASKPSPYAGMREWVGEMIQGFDSLQGDIDALKLMWETQVMPNFEKLSQKQKDFLLNKYDEAYKA